MESLRNEILKQGKDLYNQTCMDCCKLITERYSTTTSIALKMIAKKYQYPIYSIYAFDRYMDELMDNYDDKDRKTLFVKFMADTYEAIDSGFSTNPILHAFQYTANKYGIDKDLIKSNFRSIEMDLEIKLYDESQFKEYVYGIFEVPMLMCLKVLSEGDNSMYEKLKKPMMKFGSAYQKLNCFRDIKEDYELNGRVYFAGLDYPHITEKLKRSIEEDIQRDLDEAFLAVDHLPHDIRSGYKIFVLLKQKLLDEIKRLPSEALLHQRIRLSNAQKLFIILKEKKYSILNLLIISIPLLLFFGHKIYNLSNEWEIFSIIIATTAFFLLCSILFTKSDTLRGLLVSLLNH